MDRLTYRILEAARRERIGLDPLPRRWPLRLTILAWLAGIILVCALFLEVNGF